MATFDNQSRSTPPDDDPFEEVNLIMNKFRSILALTLILAGFGLFGADTAWAQPAEHEGEEAMHEPGMFGDAGLKGIGAGIGAGLVVMGGAAGIGRIGGSAVESMARQPEASGSINFAMIVTAAMIEGATLFAVVVCLLAIIL